MAKVAEDSAQELPLNDERKPEKKLPRRVTIALAQISKRKEDLLAKRKVIDDELEGLSVALAALKPE